MKEFDPFETVGDDNLSAWAVDESHCWIQSRQPRFTKQIARLDGAKIVATGVAGGYPDTTLPWVQRNVIEKINPRISTEK